MTQGPSTLLRMLLARDSSSLVREFYGFVGPLFAAVTRDSGLINIGLGHGEGVDLAAAQRALVLHTTRDLPRAHAGRPASWLEVGCGWGGPSTLMARHAPDVRIAGLDINHDHVYEARRRAAERGLAGRVRHHVGDAQAIPFPDASFDGLYGIETAFHYPRKAEFAVDARRVLRSGGRLAIADFVQRPEHARLLERVLIGPNMRIGGMPTLFTPQDWARTLEHVGFVEVEIEDVTDRTIGLLGQWAERMRDERELLRERYPAALLSYYTLGLEGLAARVDSSPVGYVVARAKRP